MSNTINEPQQVILANHLISGFEVSVGDELHEALDSCHHLEISITSFWPLLCSQMLLIHQPGSIANLLYCADNGERH